MTASPASPTPPSLTQKLLQRNQAPVDAATRRRAALHWLDWIGCVAGGARSPVAEALRAWNPRPGAPRLDASLLGMVQSPYHAVLLDAGPANVEEMDDMHRQAILHPGPVVIPALASLARSHGLSVGTTLDALVRGYETMIRIGRAVGRHHYFYFHNTATAGVFGAAAACADALGLTAQQAAWALGNAGTQAAGLWQVRMEPVMSKQLHVGHAAWAGLSAASLAGAGLTGPLRILEGERGFFAALCESADVDAVTKPENDWLIHDTSFKPWPACRHTHATIDCVLALREQLGGSALRFDTCSVESFGDALAICDNPAPASRAEAKFSLQYCVAAAAAFGPLRPEQFDEDCFSRDDLRADASRVTLVSSSEFDAAYPDHYGARVTLRLGDGRTISHQVDDSLGDPERALSPEAVFDKARQLMAYGGVPVVRANEVIEATQALLESCHPERGGPNSAFPAALLRPLFEES